LLCIAALFALSGEVEAAQGAPSTEGLGEPVSYSTEDGVTIHGRLFLPPEGKEILGGIVFVHEPMRTAREWTYMAEKMAKHGFYGLIFDLRGHGLSLMQGEEELDREMFGPEEFSAMVHDVVASVGRMRAEAAVDADRVHLAGSDLGGSLAVLAAIDDPAVRSVAMLSPGLGYDGVNMVKKVAAYGKRNLMLVYSSEDSYSRKSAGFFQREARGAVHVETYYGVGHGTKMLSREPKLETLMTAWFLGTVLTDEGRTLAETGQPLTLDKEVATNLDEEAERERLKTKRKEAEESRAEAVGEEEERKRWQDEVD
jgi:pimeloyl-ACP methyl ester carboxylesterase